MSTPGNDIQFSTDSVGSHESPLWRYFVAELDGTGLTDYSKLASNRVVTPILNAPLTMTGDVPSDNAQVWLTSANDGDPFLAPGTRLMYGFRRESATAPYYVIRASTLCMLVEDSAAQDDARSKFTGYDPWKYMMSRPIVDASGNVLGSSAFSIPGTTYLDGKVTFTAAQASVVIATLLGNTISNNGHAYIDAGVTYIGTGFWTGTLETGAGMIDDWTFLQGTSVGQAWQQMTATGKCDIWLEPIYDPFNRPTYLVQMSVFAQMGSTQDEQIFAWNLPGRSLVGITRTIDDSVLANKVEYHFGQGGPAAALQTDAASVAQYGEYWAQQFYPGQDEAGALSLAERAVDLRKDGKQTVTFKPAPERSPRPWQDYNLGDRCPVWASAQAFRQLLGEQTVGTITSTQYQRIYGWVTNISDEALETLDPVLTSPQGFA